MIITADSHFGATTNSISENGVPSTLNDIETRMYELIAEAVNDDRVLVIAGDLFDSPDPKSYVIGRLFKIFRVAKKKMVSIFIIAGNHDSSTKWSSVVVAKGANFDNVYVIDRPQTVFVKQSDISVDFLPHMSKVDEEAFFKSQKVSSYAEFFKRNGRKVDMLISHGTIAGAKNSSEVEMEADNSMLLNIKKFPFYRLVVLGHIHKAQRIPIISRGKSFNVLYAGSPIPYSFAESTERKSYIVVRKTSSKLQFKVVPFVSKVRQYKVVKINLLNGRSLQLSDEKIKRVAEDKILKIIVYVDSREIVEESKIRNAFNKYGYVVKFEYVVSGSERSRIEGSNTTIFTSLNHSKLLQQFVNGRDDLSSSSKKLVMVLGREVITECLNK